MIIGDPKTASKFYIINSKNEIEYVPSYDLAISYVNRSDMKEWYGKTLYCTNEEIIQDENGKLVLASELQRSKRGTKTELLQYLRIQFDDSVKEILNNIAKKYEYESFDTAITWINSSVEKYRDFAQALSDYRDVLYLHIENTQKALKEVPPEEMNNMDSIIQKFTEELPEFDYKD